MPPLLNGLLIIFSGLYAALLLGELVLGRAGRRWGWEIGLLLAALALLHWSTGFPRPGGRRAFGGTSELWWVGLMLIAILMGMAARYIFYQRRKFSWRSFLRPFLVSPIVLLPFLGTFPFGSQPEPVQVASFAILAFQNGFFWRVIFERAKGNS